VTESKYYFKILSEEGVVSSFSCGDEWWQADVSNFLKEDALHQQHLGLNKTWLCYSVDEPEGFVSLTASSLRISKEDILRPKYTETMSFDYFPCVLLGQFGDEENEQGQGIGKLILDWVIGLVVELDIGVRFLTVHVERVNERGLSFWTKQGFDVAQDDPRQHLIYMEYDLYSTTG